MNPNASNHPSRSNVNPLTNAPARPKRNIISNLPTKDSKTKTSIGSNLFEEKPDREKTNPLNVLFVDKLDTMQNSVQTRRLNLPNPSNKLANLSIQSLLMLMLNLSSLNKMTLQKIQFLSSTTLML